MHRTMGSPNQDVCSCCSSADLKICCGPNQHKSGPPACCYQSPTFTFANLPYHSLQLTKPSVSTVRLSVSRCSGQLVTPFEGLPAKPFTQAIAALPAKLHVRTGPDGWSGGKYSVPRIHVAPDGNVDWYLISTSCPVCSNITVSHSKP